jgi:membrane protein required for colicin V production
MNAFDMVIVVVFAYCLIRGIFRGLVKEMASIVGVLAGFYGAYTYYPALAKVLSRWVSTGAYVNILSFLLVFCAVFLVISIMGVILKYILSVAFLGWVDRTSGAVFGAVKAILITSVLMIAFTTFLPANSPFVRDSFLAPRVSAVAETLAKVVTQEMKGVFGEKINALKKSWQAPVLSIPRNQPQEGKK